MVKTKTLELETPGNGHMENITPQVGDAVKSSGIKDGIAVVFVPGATGAVTTIEYEDGLDRDMRELMDRLIPQEKEYHHNLKWGDGNGHSHLRASLVGPSLAVPVSGGSLVLGTWQQVVFLDFDNRARSRRLIVQMVGE